MTVNATLMSGPIAPDSIQLPGDPARLRDAVQSLRNLARQVDQTGQQLLQADPPEGRRGRTALAMARGATRTGKVLEADAQQLGELADALDAAADALTQGQDGIDDLRQRWRQSREVFRNALTGAKDGPKDVDSIMHGIDATAAEPHRAQFQNQAGLQFTDDDGGGGPRAEAMLVEHGGAVQQAIADYRRDVHGIVDAFADLMQKAKSADREVEDRLPRRPSSDFADGDAGDDDPDHQNVSAPGAVQSLGEELHDAAQTLNRSGDVLEDIRLAIRAGRMLPEEERVGSNQGFKHDWDEHFDALREALVATRRAADTVAERLRRIDDDGATDIRQGLRDR